MPYSDSSELPDDIRKVLPVHAQHIFKKAFNSAFYTYDNPQERRSDDSREQTAFKVAWSAVKQKYKKENDGQWYKK